MQPQNMPDYSFLSGSNTARPSPSKVQRILIVVGGGVVLLIIGIVAFSLLSGGSNTSAQSLKIAQMHAELIRVSEIGVNKARTQAAKNLAITTQLTLASDQPAITDIANKDQKVTDKLLRAGQDADTDKALTEAEQRSQFDAVFTPLLVDEIREYAKELTAAVNASKSKSTKEAYQAVYDDLERIYSAAELSSQ